MSNGSVEHLLYFQGSYYCVYTDFADEEVYRAYRLNDAQIRSTSKKATFTENSSSATAQPGRDCALVPWQHRCCGPRVGGISVETIRSYDRRE